MTPRENDYNPPHMDGGTLTILVRGNEGYDGLEVADLESTEKLDSEGIGLEASFLPVPAAADEVIVFFGTRMQRLLGRDKARACVHRVRAPVQINRQHAAKERFSFAIFCASPVI
jgi:isopenicillin N synthase-like dioxygenase